jgi:transcriptional regulator with XRE-family HTH domain
VAATHHSEEHAELVRRLRARREELGLRQVDLATRIGMPQQIVSRYESGQRRLDVFELREICTALGWTLDDALKGIGTTKR